MVNLVEYLPESFYMPQSMPPVEYECTDEPRYKTFKKRISPSREVEHRLCSIDVIPQPTQAQRYSKLDYVYQDRTRIPAPGSWQSTTRPHPFQCKECSGCASRHECWKCDCAQIHKLRITFRMSRGLPRSAAGGKAAGLDAMVRHSGPYSRPLKASS